MDDKLCYECSLFSREVSFCFFLSYLNLTFGVQPVFGFVPFGLHIN